MVLPSMTSVLRVFSVTLSQEASSMIPTMTQVRRMLCRRKGCCESGINNSLRKTAAHRKGGIKGLNSNGTYLNQGSTAAIDGHYPLIAGLFYLNIALSA